MIFEENDAPILVVAGQSNAVGLYGTLNGSELKQFPLKNVWGLDRSHEKFGLDDVHWENFRSENMCIGDSWNDRPSLANLFALRWQKAIDSGADLPDLYVIFTARGGAGILREEHNKMNYWCPYIEHTTDFEHISLYPIATEIMSLAYMNIKMSGKNPKIIGLHWNQWECESETLESKLKELPESEHESYAQSFGEMLEEEYRNLFWGFFTALGSDKWGKGIPFYYYKPVSDCYGELAKETLDKVLSRIAASYDIGKVIDSTKLPIYHNRDYMHGIFRCDGLHYHHETQEYFCDIFWDDLFNNL